MKVSALAQLSLSPSVQRQICTRATTTILKIESKKVRMRYSGGLLCWIQGGSCWFSWVRFTHNDAKSLPLTQLNSNTTDRLVQSRDRACSRLVAAQEHYKVTVVLSLPPGHHVRGAHCKDLRTLVSRIIVQQTLSNFRNFPTCTPLFQPAILINFEIF